MSDDALFDLPPDLEAVLLLTRGLDQLREAVADLAGKHAALADRVAHRSGSGTPGLLRWVGMDRDTAGQVWAWLIDWVGWFVHHYDLQEEIPSCWPRHWPLVEELTGLCAAWHAGTNDEAAPDDLLRWHEALGRARPRLRDWDQHTKCRNGQHSAYTADLAWADTWRPAAQQVAAADISTRPEPRTDPVDAPARGGERR